MLWAIPTSENIASPTMNRVSSAEMPNASGKRSRDSTQELARRSTMPPPNPASVQADPRRALVRSEGSAAGFGLTSRSNEGADVASLIP